MTLNDLKKEVIALGFESDLQSDGVLLYAARRAAGVLFSDYEVSARGVIRVPQRKPLLYRELITVSEEEIEIAVDGAKAYSFSAVGEGYFHIKDGEGERGEIIPPGESIFKGFLHGESAVIKFYGSYEFSVYNLAIFDTLYGQSEASIPLISASIEIDPRSRISDFASFLSPIKRIDGSVISEARTENGIIALPKDFSGSVCFSYKRLPPEITAQSDAKIDIPRECEHIFTLLSASYVWLDDDADKATFYLSLYKDGLRSLIQNKRTSFVDGYCDLTGWA